MTETVKDVVCGMDVEPHRNPVIHLGQEYAFCSVQCQERFVANPHLYIGLPGREAPRQAGLEVLKRRRLRLAKALSPAQATRVAEALQTMMGIRSVLAEGDKVEIIYDLLQVTAEQLEARLTQAGVRLGGEWPERLRRAFVHYEEECEIGNLEVHEGRDTHGHD